MKNVVLVVSASLLCGLILIVAGPAEWFREPLRGTPESATSAVVFGFGFERADDGSMVAGAANEFLLAQALSLPGLERMLVQEGVWVAGCAQDRATCSIDGVDLYRIDRHDDSVDLNTVEIAACALERLDDITAHTVAVVAHDMHLARATSAVERAQSAGFCAGCGITVAHVPDTPYPQFSDQLRTRNEAVYRLIDLAARVRDSGVLGMDVPETCPMPVAGIVAEGR